MVGSACATMLSTPLAPFLTHFFPRALDMTRNALEGDSDSDLDEFGNSSKPRSSAWVRLSVLRLIGVVPWSGINIACGVCGVAITDCMLGAFIGALPWTAVTCQVRWGCFTRFSHASNLPRFAYVRSATFCKRLHQRPRQLLKQYLRSSHPLNSSSNSFFSRFSRWRPFSGATDCAI